MKLLCLGLVLVLALTGCNQTETPKNQIKENTTYNISDVSNDNKTKTNQGKHLGQKKHPTVQENMWRQDSMNTDFRQWIQTTGIDNLDMNQTHVGAYRNVHTDPVTGEQLRDPNTGAYIADNNWNYFFSITLKNNAKLNQAQYDMIKNYIQTHYNAKIIKETGYTYMEYENHNVYVDLNNDVFDSANP